MSHNPPNPDAGGGGSEKPPEQNIVVNDPEDFAKTRQLKSLFDDRDKFVKSREMAQEEARHKAAGPIFHNLQDYIMAAEPLLRSSEKGEEVLNERTYTTDNRFVSRAKLLSFEQARRSLTKAVMDRVTPPVSPAQVHTLLHRMGVDLPEQLIEEKFKEARSATAAATASVFDSHSDVPARVNLSRLKTDIERLGGRSVASAQVEVLMELLFGEIEGAELDWKRRQKAKIRGAATDWGWSVEGAASLTGEIPVLAYRKKHSHEFGTTAPPPWISNEVFVDVQSAITDLGLGVSFSEEQQTKIDSDLLKEVDQWRRENVK